MFRGLLFPIPLLGLAAQEDPGVIATNQAITPAGVQSVFRGRVYGVTFGANPAEVPVLTAGGISHFAWKSNPIRASSYMLGALLFLIPLLRLAAQEDPGVITTNQAITPAGVQSVFRGRVCGVTFGANPAEVRALAAAEIAHFDWKSNPIRT